MNQLFDRVASVSIGPENAEGIKLSGIRIAFDITKSIKPNKNKAQIILTNISAQTRSLLKNDNVIVLKAGYSENIGEEVLFTGYIKHSYSEYQSVDIHTIIEAVDGSKKLEESTVTISYKGGITVKNLLIDLSKRVPAMQFDFSKLDIEDLQISNGVAYAGELKQLLNYLCESVNLDWSFQNNTLKVQSKHKADLVNSLRISPSTGMIGSPEYLSDILKDGKKTQDLPGWRIKSLLIPSLEPGNPILIDSRELTNKATFKVHELIHKGDTHGNDWTTTMYVEEVVSNESFNQYNLNVVHSNDRLA